jgi:hypothetical protein
MCAAERFKILSKLPCEAVQTGVNVLQLKVMQEFRAPAHTEGKGKN